MGSSKKYSNGYWKVYVHINKINGKKYVGITSQKVEYRWNYGKAYGQNPHFNSAIKKYGWDNFEHVVLYDYLSEEEAKEKEIELIAEWKTQDRRYGYNATAGGEGLNGYIPSPELRALWSKIRTGTKRSEETKKRMSESSVFRDPNRRDEVIRKISESKYKKVSQYTIDGEFVRTFDSITGAAEILGLTNSQRSHISDCCKGIRKSSGGYKWEYA